MPPPLLYDLTELQRHANRLYGFSAQKTLELAQALYERHKLLSYPRTDSRHLSQDVAATLPRIVQGDRGAVSRAPRAGTGERPLGRRFVDDAKVTRPPRDHPDRRLARRARRSTPTRRKIYDLVCRRLLAAWHDDHVWSVTTVITADPQRRTSSTAIHTSGTAVEQLGWKVLDIGGGKKPREEAEAGRGRRRRRDQTLPPGLAQGQPQEVLDVEGGREEDPRAQALHRATLLTAMETAGKTLDEKELSDAMKETGLGTPATRAAIIEALLEARVHRARRQDAGGDRQRDPADRGGAPRGEEPGDDRPVGGVAAAHRARAGAARRRSCSGIEDYVREVVGKVGRRPPLATRRNPRDGTSRPCAPAQPRWHRPRAGQPRRPLPARCSTS